MHFSSLVSFLDHFFLPLSKCVVGAEIRATSIIEIGQLNLRNTSSIENEEYESVEEDFLQELFSSQSSSHNEDDIEKFLCTKPKKLAFSSFATTSLREQFIKFNTPIPSSAAVERLFSLGKDILRPKRAGLSNEHFNMLVFLKGNDGK